jgi:hypothetical protein
VSHKVKQKKGARANSSRPEQGGHSVSRSSLTIGILDDQQDALRMEAADLVW